MNSKCLNKMGLFPRKTKPQIAIAYSFESRVVTDYAKSYYRSGFLTQIQEVYYSLYVRNLDCNIVDLRNMTKEYKLLIIPGIALIDPQSNTQFVSS